MVVERPAGEDARQVAADQLPAVPPSTDLLRIARGADDVCERDLQPTSHCLQLVHAEDVEDDAIVFDTHVEHVGQTPIALLPTANIAYPLRRSQERS